jgi:hypothetical protein
LPSSSGDSKLIPVMLPPGRASDAAKPSATHVLGHADKRDGPGERLQSSQWQLRTGNDRVGRGFHHGLGNLADAFDRNAETTRNHAEISALDEAMGTQLIEERDDPRRVASNLGQKAETVGAASLLPARRQRPGRRPANQRNERTPVH